MHLRYYLNVPQVLPYCTFDKYGSFVTYATISSLHYILQDGIVMFLLVTHSIASIIIRNLRYYLNAPQVLP